MYSLGAVGGSLSVIGWGALNTCELPCNDLTVKLEILKYTRHSDPSR